MKKIIIKITSIILVISVLIFQFGMLVSARIEREFDFSKLVYSETLSRYLYDGNGVYIHKSNVKDSRPLFGGAAFYVVGDSYFDHGPFKKTVVFYGGDGTDINTVKATIRQLPGGYIVDHVSNSYFDRRNIERMVFTADYTILPNHFYYMSNLKEVIFLNDCEITSEYIINETGTANYTIYGTTEHHRAVAQKVNHPYHDLNNVILDAVEGTKVNIDETNCVISGLTPKTTADSLIRNCLSPKACDAEIEKEGYVGTGDKVNLVKWLDDSDAGSYDILLYGDVDGDGIYDARDAYLVNLMANGILTEDQVGSLKWSAADCNHDGEVNASDVLILEQAGLMLANVDQTKSGDELQEDAAFTDYVELIDQNPAADEVTEEKPASIFDRIIEFIKIIIDFVKSLFVKF